MTEREPGVTKLPRSLGVKVGMLLALTIVVAVGFLAYVLYARGVFEATQRLTLVAENAEGVSVGMDLTFAGFPIGRVSRISLAEDGKARIEIDVPRADARWLRASSVFTLEVPLVGSARIRAFTGNLQDVPLADGAERPVLRGDTAEEIPRMVATLRTTLENIERMTAATSSLQQSLDHARTFAERMSGRYGALGAALGSEENAQQVLAALDRTNKLLASVDGVALKLDGMIARTDRRLHAEGGIADEVQRAAAQANTLLTEARERLKSVDAILANAQAASASAKTATANVAAASTDLAALRAEVEASIRKVAHLIDEINRKWPFERDTEVRLP
jgi:phospholipid/cholesterol/gamma-HCH transport system substrate-binding protein